MTTIARRQAQLRCTALLVAAGVVWALPVTTGLAATQKAKSPPAHVSRFPRGGMPESARGYYAMNYGVDQLSVSLTESGQLVKFSYRVVDANLAKPLQDRAANPNLLDEAAHAVLVVPTMEKVGPLRQSMAAEEGKSYWMTFSNKGNLVKTGHMVSVVIGPVRIDGLIVQ